MRAKTITKCTHCGYIHPLGMELKYKQVNQSLNNPLGVTVQVSLSVWLADGRRNMKYVLCCDHCGKEFERYLADMRSNSGYFCSRKCRDADQRGKPKERKVKIWKKIWNFFVPSVV
jgi:hypothetical protein